MQTTAIGTVANSLPKNKVILLTLLSSKRYILIAELRDKHTKNINLYSNCQTLNFHKMFPIFPLNYLGEQKNFSLFARKFK